MRIEGPDFDRVRRTEPLRPTAKSGGTNGVSQAAGKSSPMVALSGIGQVMGGAVQQVENAPSMQAERVAELKQQVQSGSYHVDTQELADRLSRILK